MKTNKNAVVGEICLYGTLRAGAGYLARLADGRLLGDGELHEGRGFTEAVWLACLDIREAGVTAGKVWVYASCGGRKALCDLNHPGYYGDLKWETAEPAAVVTVNDAENTVTIATPDGKVALKCEETESFTYNDPERGPITVRVYDAK